MREGTVVVFSILIFAILLANWIIFFSWMNSEYHAGRHVYLSINFNYMVLFVNLLVFSLVLIPYGFYRYMPKEYPKDD